MHSRFQIVHLTVIFISALGYFIFAKSNLENIRNVIIEIDSVRVINDANQFLKQDPLTINSFPANRSLGTLHDYYSEGDYWWPNPDDPAGPYIRKDGLTNPNNFNAHRDALRKFSIQFPTLVAAYIITGDSSYLDKAVQHLYFWFVNDDTRMNPSLKFAQAIKGVSSGRGIGIIDTIHLVEIVQAIIVLEKLDLIADEELTAIKNWFREYNEWLFTDQFGIDERDNGNNHSTCWNIQVAQYSKFINDKDKLEFCREHYKFVLLPDQMSVDGSFPLELKRTKPYGYSLFNLDAMVMVVEILSLDNDLWKYYTSDGKNIKSAVDFMYPYIKDKTSWPFQKDVMYFDDWPVRQPSLLFSGIAYDEEKFISLWTELDPSPQMDEIIRNFFIRQPILWIDD